MHKDSRNRVGVNSLLSWAGFPQAESSCAGNEKVIFIIQDGRRYWSAACLVWHLAHEDFTSEPLLPSFPAH